MKKAAVGLLLLSVSDASSSQPDLYPEPPGAREAITKQMEASFGFGPSQYSASSPAAAQAATNAMEKQRAASMGAFYKAQYTPPGMMMAGVGGATQADVQSQQANMAAKMGQFYASQFAPPGVSNQVAAQQAAMSATIDAQNKAIAAAAAEANLAKAQAQTSPQVLAAPGGASPEDPTKPAVPRMAEDCHTLEELKAWYKNRLNSINKYVPGAYSHFADDSLKSEYEKNKKRIEGGGDETSGSGDSTPPKVTPLMMDASTANSAQGWSFGGLADRFKSGVAGATSSVSSGADAAAKKVNEDAQSAQEQADEIADRIKERVAEVSQRIKEQQEAEQKGAPSARSRMKQQKSATPEMLASLADEPPATVTGKALYMLPAALSIGAVVMWARRQALVAWQADEANSVYHMQP
eukprot:TRINITY_DN52031_c0_g1_i1.p1 TRINITY_DN52031_c0_g1~~TRINITY_DN52031_c0_g1_i1.p1  ORF type:complete len:409 (-),score=136.90 TRINITY_DN52031_c0_g1_i1:302-1528(-)